MADVNATNRAKAEDPSPANILSRGTLGGKKRVMYDTYECASTAANTVIKIGQKLPAGAMVTNIVVWNDALGSGGTFDVGDAQDIDRYIDGAASNTAGVKTLNVASAFGHVITGEDASGKDDGDLQIKVLGVVHSGTFHVVVEYVNE